MTKTIHTAPNASGNLLTRTTATSKQVYSHAVIVGDRALSWHSRRDLADRAAQAYDNRPWMERSQPGARAQVMQVQVHVKVSKPQTAAQRVATKAGVVTRAIGRLEDSRGYWIDRYQRLSDGHFCFNRYDQGTYGEQLATNLAWAAHQISRISGWIDQEVAKRAAILEREGV